MDRTMEMFIELVNALAEANNIDRLKLLKTEIESDMVRIGPEYRLSKKYDIVSEAIAFLKNKKTGTSFAA